MKKCIKSIILLALIIFTAFGYQKVKAQTTLQEEIDSLNMRMLDATEDQQISLIIELASKLRDVDLDAAQRKLIYGISLAEELDKPIQLAKMLTQIGQIHNNQAQYDSALLAFERAENIIDLEHNYDIKTSIINNRGITFFYLGDYSSARIQFEHLLKLALTQSNSKDIGRAYSNIGLTHQYEGNYEKALPILLKAAHHEDSLGNKLGSAKVYNNMALLHSDLGNYDQAIEYYNISLKLKLELGNKRGAEGTYFNLATLYKNMREFNKSLEYYTKALELAREINYQTGIFDVLNGLSVLYNHMLDHESAIKYGLEALNQAESTSNNQMKATIKVNLADSYRLIGNLKLAEKYGETGLSEIREFGTNNNLYQSLNVLSEMHEALGNYKKSLLYYKEFNALGDTIRNSERDKTILSLQTKYETEKKEQQIILLNKDKALQASTIENNRMSIIALIIFIVSAFILALWLFKRTQYKQRLKLEMEKAKSKDEQVKAVINSQEKERKRFAMDLHDDFGQLLSAMKLNVHRMKDKSDSDTMDKSETLLENMYSSLKNIAFDLMPHTLFEKGLEEALDELKDQINSSEQLRLDVQSFGIKNKIEGDQKIALYRIIQELVSNIIKYSNAQKVNISITDHGDGLTLMIEDDGLGYDFNTFKNGKGNGWKNIQSRLGLLNGEIEIDTMKGRKNTTVALDIPYSIKEETVAA